MNRDVSHQGCGPLCLCADKWEHMRTLLRYSREEMDSILDVARESGRRLRDQLREAGR